MINKFALFVLLLIFLSLSCNNQFAQETKSFKTYMSDIFHEKIPQNEHTYLLIATFRCSGCVENALMKISQKTNVGSENSITILTFDSSLIPDTLKNKVKVLLDKDAGYENIGIPIANIALIKSSKGKVDKIMMINLDDTDKIVDEDF